MSIVMKEVNEMYSMLDDDLKPELIGILTADLTYEEKLKVYELLLCLR